ncbi:MULTISPECIES: homoserine kinase [Aerosakkonema]|uniref:homoserine kinase n=1 Tax=Aerosakkonema TaxID=1246629 RepID=UPI0035B8D116
MVDASTVSVTVPATTANLGPGFDCIGAALTLYNEFKFSRLEPSLSSAPLLGGETGQVKITVTGVEADRVKTDESNLAYQSFLKLYRHIDRTPPAVEIQINLDVPLARGLGSSATAIVGGLIGANQLAGAPLSQTEVMELAIGLEGHPDNVVPAFLGGCRLAATAETENKIDWQICDVPWHSDIVPLVAIPDFELSTAEARRVLPTEYSRADAIFNTAHCGLLVRALESGRGDWLRVALQDRIHQPYRQALIPGYDAVREAALAKKAYGMVISGAGPTLLALANFVDAPDVAVAMAAAWQQEGIKSQVRSLSIDVRGAKIDS